MMQLAKPKLKLNKRFGKSLLIILTLLLFVFSLAPMAPVSALAQPSESFETVSYTHLDVYKRQAGRYPKEPALTGKARTFLDSLEPETSVPSSFRYVP